jgi:hypothetical protein
MEGEQFGVNEKDGSTLPHPLRLCVEVLHYSVFQNKITQELTCGELRKRIESIFGPELVEKAFQVETGNYNPLDSKA